VVAQTGDHVVAGLRILVTGDGIAARMWRSGDAQRVDAGPGGSGTTVRATLPVG
jgi:hypothetical protein